MKVFFDCEFTSLNKAASLISIGLISEDGRTFYAESNTWGNPGDLDEWVRDNVIANLRFSEAGYSWLPSLDLEHHEMKCGAYDIGATLRQWLEQFEQVEIWGDVLAYDWTFFCDLFGGAFNIPKNIYYIPFDIATLMKIKDVDPDVSREEFAGIGGAKHNALHDAKVIRACYERLSQ